MPYNFTNFTFIIIFFILLFFLIQIILIKILKISNYKDIFASVSRRFRYLSIILSVIFIGFIMFVDVSDSATIYLLAAYIMLITLIEGYVRKKYFPGSNVYLVPIITGIVLSLTVLLLGELYIV